MRRSSSASSADNLRCSDDMKKRNILLGANDDVFYSLLSIKKNFLVARGQEKAVANWQCLDRV